MSRLENPGWKYAPVSGGRSKPGVGSPRVMVTLSNEHLALANAIAKEQDKAVSTVLRDLISVGLRAKGRA